MIDKAKLLQWIEDKEFVYAYDPEDDSEELERCRGALTVLSKLGRDIELGEFDSE